MEFKWLPVKAYPHVSEAHKAGVVEFWKSDEARSASNESVVKTIGMVGSSDVGSPQIPEDVLSQSSIGI
jgi:hypothetical protein